MRTSAGQVLEAMSQDSGPSDCEPYTVWAVDLARQVLGLRAALEEIHHRVETRRTGVSINGESQWSHPLFGEIYDVAHVALIFSKDSNE